MKKLLTIALVVCLAMSSTWALMGRPDTTLVNTDGVKITGRDADIAVKTASDVVINQSANLKDSTVQNFTKALDGYNAENKMHLGLGLGADFSKGLVGINGLMSVRKKSLMCIASVGITDTRGLIQSKSFSGNAIKVGVGLIKEF